MAFHGVNGIIEIVQHYFFRFFLLVHAHAALVRCFYMLVYIYRGGVNEGLLSRYCLPLAARRCYLALVFFGVGLRVIGGCVWRGCVWGCFSHHRAALGVVLHGVVSVL